MYTCQMSDRPMSGSYAGIITCTYRRLERPVFCHNDVSTVPSRIYVDVTSVVLVVDVVVVVVVTAKYVDKQCTERSNSVLLVHQFTVKENKKPQTVVVIGKIHRTLAHNFAKC